MDVNIVAVLIFIIFAVLFPVSFLLTSIMLRRRTVRNAVRDAPYESAERSTGGEISIMNEYVHYFPMFIAYEVVASMVLVWAPVSRLVSFNASLAMLGLLGFGIVLEAFVVLIARKKD